MVNWFRKAYLAAEDLRTLVQTVDTDIRNYPTPDSVANMAKTIVDNRSYLHDPKTGRPSVSAKELEWFWSEMKRIYTERGGEEVSFPALTPPATFGPSGL